MLIQRIINKLKDILGRYQRPVFVIGYKNSDGVYCPLTRIGNTTFLSESENLKLADNVFIGHYSFIEASNGITIHEGAQIGYYVTITTHSSHDSIRLYGPEYGGRNMIGYLKGSIEIGAYTFVGPYTTIMPGTKIGKGCLVSSYSNLKGDYPDFSIIAGNPAKVVGDTRDRDEPFFKQYPELLDPKFQAWRK